MRWTTGTSARRLGALTALCGLGLAASAVLAGPATADAPACNGMNPNLASDNTSLTVHDGSDTSPGGVVALTLSYPGDDGEDAFEVRVCVTHDGAEIQNTADGEAPNGGTYSIEFTVPEDATVGSEICVVAQTTGPPSDSQGSNRKAEVCFLVAPDVVDEEPSESPEPTVEPSEPVVEEDDPEPSVSPTVLGVKIVQPTLPHTGGTTEALLAVGLLLVVAGTATVATTATAASRRRH